ncbi:hypothetical protein H0274_05680 [Altererythrobacter sp. CC-YST694]|uniref:hypothetical protein n=1 Tax=Altererythrobacter sp. CC-YST694 TaxID=2755038 RepID=UPI001D006935|nr:hypothetical protein [Altererythrobacter sp. CC-YST694]MCB5424740.1 hypothetical protein [Altererythrobacter sp. CC-YST694]
MSLPHRGIAFGALVGIMVGMMSSVDTPTKVVGPMIACTLIGWLIGRYMEMRKPRS